MSEFKVFLNEQLEDETFRKEWENMQSEMREMIATNTSTINMQEKNAENSK